MSDTPRTDAECMSGGTRYTDMVHYTFAQQLERELADAESDYKALARQLDGHDATECLLNLNRLKRELAEAREQRDRLAFICREFGTITARCCDWSQTPNQVSATSQTTKKPKKSKEEAVEIESVQEEDQT